MPLYEFHCLNCLLPFDAIVPVGSLTTPCAHCLGEWTERTITAPKSYRINGDNSSSQSPKRFNHGEERRKEGKRERLDHYYKHGKWK